MSDVEVNVRFEPEDGKDYLLLGDSDAEWFRADFDPDGNPWWSCVPLSSQHRWSDDWIDKAELNEAFAEALASTVNTYPAMQLKKGVPHLKTLSVVDDPYLTGVHMVEDLGRDTGAVGYDLIQTFRLLPQRYLLVVGCLRDGTTKAERLIRPEDVKGETVSRMYDLLRESLNLYLAERPIAEY